MSEQRLAWTSFGKVPRTPREYLADHYAALIYRRMSVNGASSKLATTVALYQRNRLRAAQGGMSPLGVNDERAKLAGRCIYCDAAASSVDHLIPRLAGGPDSVDNFVPACSSCNSSKGARDLFDWAARKGFFPLGATRRYLVLASRWCERAGVHDAPFEKLVSLQPPFRTSGLPWQWAKVALSRPPSRFGAVVPVGHPLPLPFPR